MARRRRKNPSSRRVEYAQRGSIAPWDGRKFAPHKARGGEYALLREPRSAIREYPLTFAVGSFLAGVVGTLMLKGMQAPVAAPT